MKEFLRNTWKHRAHMIMLMPAMLILLFFSYVPMGGLVLAFKKFEYSKGIFGSPWVAFENFRGLILSKSTFFSITKNTLMYYVIFTVITTFLNVVVAIAIDRFMFKKFGRVMQTVMIIPVFISYAAVQFIVYAFLSSDTGIVNNTILPMLGHPDKISFYMDAAKWPVILTFVKVWHDVGYGSVLYMSVLSGIDQELYEAADIDGASSWQKIWYVTLPMLIPMITVMLLLSVGGIMHSDTGLFYQITRNSGVLYPTTQVIDSYVLNAIMQNSNFGFTAAASFFQSCVGLLLMLFANFTVSKLAPENALF